MIGSERGRRIAGPILVALVGLNLRPVFATIGPATDWILEETGASYAFLSLLTVVPLLVMGAGTMATSAMPTRGRETNLVVGALMLIVLGTGLRLVSAEAPLLLVSAAVAGLGIAVCHALIPAWIKARAPQRVSSWMGMHIGALMVGAACAAAATAPLISWRGGRLALGLWAVPAIVALGLWLIAAPRVHLERTLDDELPAAEARSELPKSLWKVPRYWTLAFVLAASTAGYMTMIAWLAPYYIDLGWTPRSAGFALSVVTACEILGGFAFPALASERRSRPRWLAITCLIAMVGLLGLALAPEQLTPLWLVSLGVGLGGMFPLILVIAIDHVDDAHGAGVLTARVQGVGYALSAPVPFLVGMARDRLDSFVAGWWLLIGLFVALTVAALMLKPDRYSEALAGER